MLFFHCKLFITYVFCRSSISKHPWIIYYSFYVFLCNNAKCGWAHIGDNTIWYTMIDQPHQPDWTDINNLFFFTIVNKPVINQHAFAISSEMGSLFIRCQSDRFRNREIEIPFPGFIDEVYRIQELSWSMLLWVQWWQKQVVLQTQKLGVRVSERDEQKPVSTGRSVQQWYPGIMRVSRQVCSWSGSWWSQSPVFLAEAAWWWQTAGAWPLSNRKRFCK